MWVRPLGREKCRRMSQWDYQHRIDRHDASGGRGGGAPAGGARCTWSRGSSESGSVEAGQQPAWRRQPAPLHGRFNRVHLPHPASAREQAIDSVRGCSAGQARGVKRLTAWYLTRRPPHLTSRRSRSSSDLIGARRQSGAAGEVGEAAEGARPRLAARWRHVRQQWGQGGGGARVAVGPG